MKKAQPTPTRIVTTRFSPRLAIGLLLLFAAGGVVAGVQLQGLSRADSAKTYYIDPANGSDSGDGSAQRPWRTLQQVTESNKFETYNTNGSLKNAGAPIKGGDTVKLRSGYHGTFSIHSAFNKSDVTIEAEAGQTPQLKRIAIAGGSHWKIRGLTISPSFEQPLVKITIVSVGGDGSSGSSSDVELSNNTLYSVPDSSQWSKQDWINLASHGMGQSGERIVFRNNHVKNVWYGINSSGTNNLVEGNTVENFSADGMRGLGSNTTFQYNLVKNMHAVNDEHHDGFQSWSKGTDGTIGTGVVVGNTLRGNTFLAWTDPNQPFRGGNMQGIGGFDGMYKGWTIENNVIATSMWHGISFYGLLDSKIVNNTVVDIDTNQPGPPWIGIFKHKNGTPSSNVIVRNNIAEGGFQGLGITTNDHNIRVTRTDIAKYFVNPEARDYHLKPGVPAINTGSSDQTPAIDHDQAARPFGALPDIGAFEYGATITPAPTPCSAVGDLNCDQKVNIFDLSKLIGKYNTNDVSADLNHDGTVNIFDLSALIAHFSG